MANQVEMSKSPHSGMYLQTGITKSPSPTNLAVSRGPTSLTKPTFSRSATQIIHDVAKASSIQTDVVSSCTFENTEVPEEKTGVKQELVSVAEVRHGPCYVECIVSRSPNQGKSPAPQAQTPVSDVNTETDLDCKSN